MHIPRAYQLGRVCYDRDYLAALNILLLGRCPQGVCWRVREEEA